MGAGVRGPIDDARVRSVSERLRAIAFAVVTGIIGGDVARMVSAHFHAPPHPAHAWIAAGITAMLAWSAMPRRPHDLATVLVRTAVAGAIAAVASWVVLALFVTLERRYVAPPNDELVVVSAVVAAGVGLVLGATCGGGVAVLWYVVENVERTVFFGTPAWSILVTAAWSAIGLVIAAALGWALPGATVLSGVLAVMSVLVAIGAAREVVRRRAFARRAERGEIAGWRVEVDERGTRWLVREERGGVGAYREGVTSRRWARV